DVYVDHAAVLVSGSSAPCEGCGEVLDVASLFSGDVSGSLYAWHTLHVHVKLPSGAVQRLHDTALAVSTPTSPRYGRYLSVDELAAVVWGEEGGTGTATAEGASHLPSVVTAVESFFRSAAAEHVSAAIASGAGAAGQYSEAVLSRLVSFEWT